MQHEAMEPNDKECGLPKLADVLAYENLAIIARLCRKEGMSRTEAQAAFADTLRFLYLCGSSDNRFVPTEKIDVVWHHFILFTAAYADFCEKFFGRFIHHFPAEVRILSAQHRIEPDNSSYCSNCSNCEGVSSDPCTETSSTLEHTLTTASVQFGELSPNWKK